ncbi:1,4-dihydroxy-2-naphthoate polyprenyltransferase [Thaumasiovibrio subtropicus]|uniref:1,4-dihydroxy-2-naphthoate polyprenyltransferase n=1 Tax=Thaumasiovibrio subtropicus TaxID=1891207 RepID=UPI000B355631|nr:1,4-dihydroxy-2-naphthoate polyprenyltransferase [Thaumasiovibrio subtropicus]
MSSSSLSIWASAARPKTLPLAIASITCGSAVAAIEHPFSWSIAALALLTALLLQILSNLANDYGDAVKGTDNDDRLGPQRAIQSGAVSLASMKRAIAFNLLLTVASGLSLILLATNSTQDLFSFMLLGAMAIIASIAYTVGNKPYGYMGLGDLSVLIFFGWLGVAGTYYLQTGTIESLVFLPATACGLLAVGVLNINNLRDIDNDKACGKLTLAVRMGPTWGRAYHLFLLGGAVLCLTVFAAFEIQSPFGWLFLLASPLLLKHGLAVHRSADGAALRPMMATMVKCALLTNLLFAAGVMLA